VTVPGTESADMENGEGVIGVSEHGIGAGLGLSARRDGHGNAGGPQLAGLTKSPGALASLIDVTVTTAADRCRLQARRMPPSSCDGSRFTS